MEKEVQTFFKDFMKSKQKMARYIPETVKGFMGLHEKTSQPGALDRKQKELIAVGIAVANPCTACIYLHVQQAVEVGATAEEVMESAGVAVVMGGGPAFAHISEVLKVLDALGVK
jgi:AhpD family alkylhydroperoxidase